MPSLTTITEKAQPLSSHGRFVNYLELVMGDVNPDQKGDRHKDLEHSIQGIGGFAIYNFYLSLKPNGTAVIYAVNFFNGAWITVDDEHISISSAMSKVPCDDGHGRHLLFELQRNIEETRIILGQDPLSQIVLPSDI